MAGTQRRVTELITSRIPNSILIDDSLDDPMQSGILSEWDYAGLSCATRCQTFCYIGRSRIVLETILKDRNQITWRSEDPPHICLPSYISRGHLKRLLQTFCNTKVQPWLPKAKVPKAAKRAPNHFITKQKTYMVTQGFSRRILRVSIDPK